MSYFIKRFYIAKFARTEIQDWGIFCAKNDKIYFCRRVSSYGQAREELKLIKRFDVSMVATVLVENEENDTFKIGGLTCTFYK